MRILLPYLFMLHQVCSESCALLSLISVCAVSLYTSRNHVDTL